MTPRPSDDVVSSRLHHPSPRSAGGLELLRAPPELGGAGWRSPGPWPHPSPAQGVPVPPPAGLLHSGEPGACPAPPAPPAPPLHCAAALQPLHRLYRAAGRDQDLHQHHHGWGRVEALQGSTGEHLVLQENIWSLEHLVFRRSYRTCFFYQVLLHLVLRRLYSRTSGVYQVLVEHLVLRLYSRTSGV